MTCQVRYNTITSLPLGSHTFYVEGAHVMEEALRIAQAVRDACLMATLQAYEDAGLSGLCHEGRWECAVDAMRTLDLRALVQTLTSPATRVS